MVQDLTVIKNYALNQQETEKLMNRRLPPRLPTLTRLLRFYSLPSLEGFCPLSWRGNFYQQLVWGLCPDSVCGLICIDEMFLLNLNIPAQHEQYGSTHQDTLDYEPLESISLPIIDDQDIPLDPLNPIDDSYMDSLLEEYQDLYSLYGDDLFSDIPIDQLVKFRREHQPPIKGISKIFLSSSPSVLSIKSSGFYDILPQPWTHTIQSNFNLTKTSSDTPANQKKRSSRRSGFTSLLSQVSDFLGYSSSNSSSTNLKNHSFEQDSEKPPNIDNHKYFDRYSMMATAVPLLYSSAMTSLNGRSLSSTNISSNSSSPPSPQVSFSSDSFHFDRTRLRPFEQSFSALALCIWFSDQLSEMDGSPHEDVPWGFKSAPPLAQPMMMALGFRIGFDVIPRIEDILFKESLPSDYLGGISLRSIISPFPSTNDTNSRLLDYLDYFGFPSESLISDNQYPSNISAIVSSFLDVNPEVDQTQTFNSKFGDGLMENDCMSSASYYFPITQYIASHFGMADSGIGAYDTVKLYQHLGNDLDPYMGEEGDLHVFNEAEAIAGNVEAQVWLAKRYWWGLGGLDQDLPMARRFFEQAAAQNHPEALYNMGVLYFNGGAGVDIDTEKAIDFFHRSANALEPFPMSLHALGNIYIEQSSPLFNSTLARIYFEKAARLGDANGHFSLAMMLKEGVSFCQKDLLSALHHLSIAATAGHIRSINYLAHGLFDSDSWYAEFGRELRLSGLTFDPKNRFPSSPDCVTHNKSGWGLNLSSSLINITLPGQSQLIQLHWPPIRLECPAALAMFKYLSEFSYRPHELLDSAVAMYLSGSLWSSLDYYDEAADLGIVTAQDNSIVLLEELKKQECNSVKDNTHSFFHSFSRFMSPSVRNDSLPIEEIKCRQYFDEMIFRRRVQQASIGDYMGQRSIAHQLIENKSVFDPLDPTINFFPIIKTPFVAATRLLEAAALQGDSESVMSLGWLIYFGNSDYSANRSAAISLFSFLFQWERDLTSNGYTSTTQTQGFAPILALAYCYLDEWMLQFNLSLANILVRPSQSNLSVNFSPEQKFEFYLCTILIGLISTIYLLRRRRNGR